MNPGDGGSLWFQGVGGLCESRSCDLLPQCTLYMCLNDVQEWIFRIEEFRSFGWYLTLLQFAYFSAFGFVESSLKRESIRRSLELVE